MISSTMNFWACTWFGSERYPDSLIPAMHFSWEEYIRAYQRSLLAQETKWTPRNLDAKRRYSPNGIIMECVCTEFCPPKHGARRICIDAFSLLCVFKHRGIASGTVSWRPDRIHKSISISSWWCESSINRIDSDNTKALRFAMPSCIID